MDAVVVYESMYGNTHVVADAIGEGLASTMSVTVVPVGEADRALLASADLVVVGGPTHVHGMSRDSTRAAAVNDAAKPDSTLHLDPDAEGPGLRDWFVTLDGLELVCAAYDTRIDVSPVLSGRASKGISKQLRKHGLHEVVEPESFLVDKESVLEDGEADRARAWGEAVAAACPAEQTTS
jgi:flavodoxin